MQNEFSDTEARSRVGSEVETVTDLPNVPMGTRGKVVDASNPNAEGWVVRIEWDLPRRRSELMAQVGDFSFNVPWRSKVPATEFDKSEFERCLRSVAK